MFALCDGEIHIMKDDASIALDRYVFKMEEGDGHSTILVKPKLAAD